MPDSGPFIPQNRILSGLVLAPIAIGAFVAGGWVFDGLVAIAAMLMSWEWVRIAGNGVYGATGLVVSAIVLAAIAAWIAGAAEYVLALTVLGVIACLMIGRREAGRDVWWTAVGIVPITVAACSLMDLRDGPSGLYHVLWLVGAVWATDIGAYVAGKLIGGPRLAPRISPNKTWAGLAGGMVLAGLWGTAFGYATETTGSGAIIAMSVALAPISQAGDLGISVLKRRFGVKDASHIIPGHGGVLDRCDGLLLASPAIALLAWAKKGTLFA